MPSNINAATVFELRLCEEVCLAFSLKFENLEDLALARLRHAKSQNADTVLLLELQERRLKASLPTFLSKIRQLEHESGTPLKSVRWIGNKNKGKRVADVDLVFRSMVVPISIKSGGPGTERNLGARSLKNTLSFDAVRYTEEMKSEVRKLLGQWLQGIVIPTSWPKIRALIKETQGLPEAEFLIRQIGYEYQKRISQGLLASIEGSNDSQRAAFWAYLGLAADDRDNGLQIFEATDDGGTFKDPVVIANTDDIKVMGATGSEKGSLRVTHNGQALWRINVNFTNGIGCSPVAVRAFLL